MADAATAKEKKDLLLSHGAHEIRNPVAVILGYVRMLTTERLGPLTELQHKVLGDVATSTTKLAALAEEMSLLARLLAGGTQFAKARVELAGLIGSEIPSVAPAYEREVPIRVIDDFGTSVVTGDGPRLREAFNSLMFAQRRELFTCDELCVAIDGVPGNEPPAIRVTIGGADRIEGLRRLPPSDLVPLVEFRGGVGYKLTIARHVIEAHGGRVFSRTEPGDTPKSVLNIAAVVVLPSA
jgi:signal transduction histidine kinase